MTRDELKYPVRASELGRLALCPGSARMASVAPVRKSDESAERGTYLHVLANLWFTTGREPEGFKNDEDRNQASRAVEIAHSLRDSLFPSTAGWYRGGSRTEAELGFGEISDFGHADVIASVGNNGRYNVLLIDWKFGRLEVEDTDTNLQTRAYAVGAFEEYGDGNLDGVYVVIIQPWSSQPMKGPVLYQKSEIEASKAQIQAIIEASQKDDAPVNPSPEACQWCPAKAYCVAAQTHAEKFGLAIQQPGFLLETPEQMSNFLKLSKAVKKLIDERVEKITEAAMAGVEIPGFKLQPGNLRREVTSGIKAWKALMDYLTADEFAAICKVSITDLEDAVHAKIKAIDKKNTKKDATGIVEAKLIGADAIDFKRSASFLKEIKI